MVVGLGLAGCGHDRGKADPGYRNATGAPTIPSVCDHGNRVYYFHSAEHLPSALAVVPDDPTC